MPNKTQFHENLIRDDDIKVGSERSFGLVFAAVFVVIAVLPLLKGAEPRLWAAAAAAGFLFAAWVAPATLRPFNLLWFKVGQALHKIVNPLVMGLLFFTTLTPMALIMRLLGKDPLHRRFDPAAESYWIVRTPPGPAPDSMRHQF